MCRYITLFPAGDLKMVVYFETVFIYNILIIFHSVHNFSYHSFIFGK